MNTKKKKSCINKEELKLADPLLQRPTQSIQYNLAEGIGSAIPDPDDLPEGIEPNGSLDPGMVGSSSQADREEKEDQITSDN